jgi:hypothetical protein
LVRRFGPDATLGGEWELWKTGPGGPRRVASRDEAGEPAASEPAQVGYTTALGLGYSPGAAAPQPTPPQPAPVAPPMPAVPAPSAGSLWAMAVKMEGDDGRTVVYRMLNSAGQQAPQASSMQKAQFDASFVLAGAAHWTYVLVDRADEREVLYTPLDRAGRPAGPPRRMPTPHFTQTFIPSR